MKGRHSHIVQYMAYMYSEGYSGRWAALVQTQEEEGQMVKG